MQHHPEASSPELASFLEGARLRRLKGKDVTAFLRDLYAEVAALQAAPRIKHQFNYETKPQRIMVMWRICRTSAIVKGLCGEDETLDQATEVEPCPWTVPFLPTGMASARTAPIRRARQSQLLRVCTEDEGIPLLPPRDKSTIKRWCRASAIIAADLGIESSEDGLAGLDGLLVPQTCMRCDVSSAEVLAFEEMILSETLDMLLDFGERATIKFFKGSYGFSHKEANGLLRVVKTQALARSAASIEEKRALQEMRLEDYIGRSKDTMDMDGEMKGIKELAKIQGLTRTEPENMGAEFFEVIKSVAARQDRELLDPRTLKLLNGTRGEEVEPITIDIEPVEEDEDDAAALAEYDNENQHR